MKIIHNQTFTFLEFYEVLANILDTKGRLKNIRVKNCIVTDIPINYKVFAYEKKLSKIFPFYSLEGTFFGFTCVNVEIIENTFKAKEI